MIANASRLVDLRGEPLTVPRAKTPRELASLAAATIASRPINARYDGAQTTDDNRRYWAATDNFDADSANNRAVREKLVQRSRYEVANNGYADGIAQTYATDLIGTGPTLRMQTNSQGFNQLVEAEWNRWAKAVQLRKKLWTMAHAKYMDGEAIGILRINPGVRHPVRLDVQLVETEHCQTPYLEPFTPGIIDGIRFDGFGNPYEYDILRYHPGSQTAVPFEWQPEVIPASQVLHWFKLRRPGQHRGIPENTSVLNCGAASRRWREATLSAAEIAAAIAVLLNTQFQPDEMEDVDPMSTLEIERGMMTALPAGWSGSQMKAEHPNATFKEFLAAQISEQARPKSMPRNKAACDSSDYNYASGRLDHQTYYAGLDVERMDCDDDVLDKLFDQWWPLAVMRFGWLGGDPDMLNPAATNHRWDWPKHQVADLKAEADADNTRLRNGSLSLSQHYAAQGKDFEDELPRMAADYGVSPDEMRSILKLAIMNSQNQLASAAFADDAEQSMGAGDEQEQD